MTGAPVQVGGATWDWGRPYVLGILNVTPDSFSDGGRFAGVDAAVERARMMVAEGADALDVGGESTRPGARAVDVAEELRRVVPVIAALRRAVSVPISVDTTKAAVARAALEAGASIVNDVGMGGEGAALARVAASYGAVYIAMHARGTPATMSSKDQYDDVVGTVVDDLRAFAERLQAAGVARDRIVLDPGLGFAKNAAHAFELLANVPALGALGYPVCVGPSRKRFLVSAESHPVGWQRDEAAADDRLGGTAAAVTLAVLGGARMLRVHDVRVMAQAARVAHAAATRREAARAP